jgi:hypothetical protein
MIAENYTKFDKVDCGQYQYWFISYHPTIDGYCIISTEKSDDETKQFTVNIKKIKKN